ncbi:protein kinase C iota type-like [Fukomys damarensis]|uniref:protein kinase C n=1 Tax=Fukomys damarensis TaxID=885580 RepID=A0A091DYV8_FUKDA|nr:protein kinase C iota type-like [Fukomys damarensis]KFO28016.1 Protein kinase C iota type [Fukomys damarensis]
MLSDLKTDSELSVNAWPCVLEHPTEPCPGEEKSILHRAAGCCRKLYCANGHTFQAKHFSRRAHCAVCTDRVGGLGCQVYKCTRCKLLVHKKCHQLVTIQCGQHSLPSETTMPVDPSSMASDPAQPLIPRNLSTHAALEQVDEEHEAGNTAESGKASPGFGLQDFDLLSMIGRGSYGKVLLVQLKKSDHLYAMKTVKKELVNTDRIRTEKCILEQASNCPFLVGVHFCFQTESRLFFVLDYVNGGDLLFHMQRQRILHEQHARFYSAEIGLAFNYLHQRGILYRNLKQDNLLLDSEGHIKLTDYCICKEGLQPGDTTSTLCGTPNYLAPEIIRGEDYGFAVDWWTLGVMMYEMMVGESPFHLVESSDNPDQNSNHNLLQVILERKIHIPRCLSVEATSVLKSFLNRDPKERLGCCPQRGFADVQEHGFFQNVDWHRMERKQVAPPFKPNLSGGFGLDNFDPQFTNEPVRLTPVDSDIVRKIDGYEFEGFEYIDCLTMCEEEWV